MYDLTTLMIESFNQVRPRSRGLAVFINEEYLSDKQEIQLDRVKDNLRIASDVQRGAWDKHVNSLGSFDISTYKPPFYAEETPITAWMLAQRLPGEKPEDNFSPEERLIAHIVNAQRVQGNKIGRAVTRQVSQALITGSITFSNAETVLFNRNSANTITVANKWDTDAGTPVDDIDQAVKAAKRYGREAPDTVVMGDKAYMAFLMNAQVRAALDNRRIFIGVIERQQVPIYDGLTYQGVINGLNIFTVDENFYVDDAGAEVNFMPDDFVLVLNSRSRFVLAAGAVEILERTVNNNGYDFGVLPVLNRSVMHPYTYNLPPRGLVAGVQSAPMFIPVNIDATAVLQNVTT